MKARFIKQFKLDTPSGPLTINVGDEWTLTRTTDGSAVIVMGHGIQQKVPEEYFELPDRKVKESKSMKLTKARLKQIIKEELEATMREETLPSFEDFNEFVQSGGNRGSDAVKAYAQGILDNPPEGIPLDSMAGEVKLSVIQAQYMLDSPGTSPELKEMANTILRMARNLPAGS